MPKKFYRIGPARLVIVVTMCQYCDWWRWSTDSKCERFTL